MPDTKETKAAIKRLTDSADIAEPAIAELRKHGAQRVATDVQIRVGEWRRQAHEMQRDLDKAAAQ